MAVPVYKIASDPKSGRSMVARVPLQGGAEILSERPLLIGPLSCSGLVCLGCHAQILEEDFVRCESCQWPLCCQECSGGFHAEECEILAQDVKQIGNPKELGDTPRYDIIMILRGLLLKKNNPTAWQQLMSLENHAEEWKAEGDPFHNAPVTYFSRVCKVTDDIDDVHKVRGAIITNCLLFQNKFQTTLRAVYTTFSIFNHSCIPNVVTLIAPSGNLVAKTAVVIEADQEMNICYTGTMEPLWTRQQNLKKNFKFVCECRRCTDPTEDETHFSAPACSKCNKSYVTPDIDGANDAIESDILDMLSSINYSSYNKSDSNSAFSIDNWSCKYCKHSTKLSEIEKPISEWITRFEEGSIFCTNPIAEVINSVIKEYHISHYVVSRAMVYALHHLKGNSIECSKLRKQIWENQLNVISIFEPGLTRRRGLSLYQYCLAAFSVLKSSSQEGIKDGSQRTEIRLIQAKLADAVEIMSLEPEDSLERAWLEALQKLQDQVKEFEKEELLFGECKRRDFPGLISNGGEETDQARRLKIFLEA